MTVHLAVLAKAFERRGHQARLSSHLIITTDTGRRITIAGSPSRGNRTAVLADLKSAGVEVDKKLLRAVQRATR